MRLDRQTEHIHQSSQQQRFIWQQIWTEGLRARRSDKVNAKDLASKSKAKANA